MGDRTKGLIDVTRRTIKQRAESQVEKESQEDDYEPGYEKEDMLACWLGVAWACWEEGQTRRNQGSLFLPCSCLSSMPY